MFAIMASAPVTLGQAGGPRPDTSGDRPSTAAPATKEGSTRIRNTIVLEKAEFGFCIIGHLTVVYRGNPRGDFFTAVARHRGQRWYWPWLTTANHGYHRDKPWPPTESATGGGGASRRELTATRRGQVPWRTVTVYHGVPHGQLTTVSPVDTHGERRGCPSLAVVLEGSVVNLQHVVPRWLSQTNRSSNPNPNPHTRTQRLDAGHWLSSRSLYCGQPILL